MGVNHYHDGRATLGYHSDRTNEMEDGTGVCVISLGAARVISFREVESDVGTSQVHHKFLLPTGSALHMSEEVQSRWQHAILPSSVAGERMSLTFRHLVAH